MKYYNFSRRRFLSIGRAAKKLAALNGGEVCGLLLDNGYYIELVQVTNKTKKGGGFSFYVQEIRNIQKMASMLKYEIIGTFHSHPVGLPEPGPADLCNALDDSAMLIFDVLGKTAAFWQIKNQKARRLSYKLI